VTHIPSTGERVELRLGVDDFGLLYLETLVGGRVAYSLPAVTADRRYRPMRRPFRFGSLRHSMWNSSASSCATIVSPVTGIAMVTAG
jgi:hypothetical protein